jgi:hypothetical protein
LKESLIEKKLEIDPPDTIALFFASCLSFLPFSKEFIYSSNNFAITM